MVQAHMDDHVLGFANDDFPNGAFETDKEERDDGDASQGSEGGDEEDDGG